jgi:hypothetical protein
VLARRQSPSRGSVRYYLWSGDQLRRIPDRLHYDLLDRAVAFPEFAGTRQRIIEAFVQPLTATARTISARGLIYTFDVGGFLNLRPMREEALRDYTKGPAVRGNVVDLQRVRNRTQFARTYSWKPTTDLIARIKADIAPRRSKASKLPLLKAPSAR